MHGKGRRRRAAPGNRRRWTAAVLASAAVLLTLLVQSSGTAGEAVRDGRGPAAGPAAALPGPGHGGPRQGREAAEPPPCPEGKPPGELDPARMPEPPAGATVTEVGIEGCAVPMGFADVRKLGGAMMINDPARPQLIQLSINHQMVSAPGYFQIRHLGRLTFPDAESTFLAFGFQPVTARVEFTNGPVTIVTVQRAGEQPHTTVGYDQWLRLHDVRVNGVPWDVGPDCRTAGPVDTVLEGAAHEYDVLGGGTLRGTVDIPPFTGCGSGRDDVSPLLTAAISGPGNYVEISQSAVCSGDCRVPDLPELPRH
ncbi:hypothetical protein [Streptomyces sp. YIM 98790]|uniref:hypothetical protein n=1 Tax=Streptomyces sp. YIM 98790 TaxID=2689077 RepID=UPI00140B77A5|nr:hypothetical protein [Streptomyces sp. YIM 98790]